MPAFTKEQWELFKSGPLFQHGERILREAYDYHTLCAADYDRKYPNRKRDHPDNPGWVKEAGAMFGIEEDDSESL